MQDCQKAINRYLNELALPELPFNLYNPIKYMMNLEAKRIRPSLVLMACNVFNDHIESCKYPALAIEVFHNFTLVHDDIMDNSNMRRGQETVHIRWNPDIALLSGDAMVIKAYELLCQCPPKYLSLIFPVFNQTALQVCEGQQYDMDYENEENVSIQDYLKMVEYKTAVLIAASLKIGALIGNASKEDAASLYNFGKNIGIAFQLQDDMLDVFSDNKEFGKICGNDIVANKKTMLLIEALSGATGSYKQELHMWLKKKEFNREEKISRFKEIYVSLHVDRAVQQRIEQYHKKALKNLNEVSVDKERIQELLQFSDYLMKRKK